MERVKDLEEFFELYNRLIESGEKLTTLTVFEDKKVGGFLHEIRAGQIKTNDEERNKLIQLGLLTEEHILKIEGKIPRKTIRKPGTAAKEIIIILKEMKKFIDITKIPNEAKLSDVLSSKQIDKIRNKTGLKFDDDLKIKFYINSCKYGGIPTKDNQRQELKDLGVMSDKNIKKLEGKISKIKKKNKANAKEAVVKDESEKRKSSPKNSLPGKMMKILLTLDEMGVDMTEIRQADTLKKHISQKLLDRLKSMTGIEDIDLDFRIGMYIDNIRQGHIKLDDEQREELRKIDVLTRGHIMKLEKKDKLSAELKNVLSEIEAIDIEEEEIKNELARIKAREKELQEKLASIEEKRNNAQKNLQALNSKETQNKSR